MMKANESYIPAHQRPLLHRSRVLLWGAFMMTLIAAPLLFDSGSSVSLLSQLGTLMIFALSYNMLLGQGGMLSFGHAVYAGLGGFFAAHVLNLVGKEGLAVPVSLIPLVGGIFGLLFGSLFGYVNTKKGGTAFSMITLGIVELVYAASHMLPRFFGNEGGISTNRTVGEPVWGVTFGPPLQVYYLIAAWLFVCTMAMFALTHTPLGRIANAVRDNPERAEFIGYNAKRVRYMVFMLSAFFAGVSGGLTVLNFEIVGSESVGVVRSGDGLLFAFIGGVGSFWGPMIGTLVGGLLSIKLSDLTMAWPLYIGIFFMIFVVYAPGGLASLAIALWQVWRNGGASRLAPALVAVSLACLVMATGVVVLVELLYASTFGTDKVALVTAIASLVGPAPAGWWLGGLMSLVGGLLFWRAKPFYAAAWVRANAGKPRSEVQR